MSDHIINIRGRRFAVEYNDTLDCAHCILDKAANNSEDALCCIMAPCSGPRSTEVGGPFVITSEVPTH